MFKSVKVYTTLEESKVKAKYKFFAFKLIYITTLRRRNEALRRASNTKTTTKKPEGLV
jgi:hypothetical protein